LYCEIAKSGGFYKLYTGKGNSDEVKSVEAWEAIMKRNSSENGTFDYDSHKQLLTGYHLLTCKHLYERAILLSLSGQIDWATLQEARARGYKIKTDNSHVYAKTLGEAFSRCNNLVTKINIKKGEIERAFPKKNDNDSDSFDTIMASLAMAAAPMIIHEDVTLARFNEINKILKKRASLAKRKDNVRV
jgi:hypothetical protein